MEGAAALLGSENGSRYRGVSQLQSHQSRYTATKGEILVPKCMPISFFRRASRFQVGALQRGRQNGVSPICSDLF